MKTRIDQELDLLRSGFPELEYREEGRWVRLPRYVLHKDWGWNTEQVEIAFQFPAGFPGQKPYGFHVCPPLHLTSGVAVLNVGSSESPFAGSWQKFSWDIPEWVPGDTPASGSNMLDFVVTFAYRLGQGA